MHTLIQNSADRFVFRPLVLLTQTSIRHPKRVLAIVALVTLAGASGMGRLKLRTDGHALVSPNDPQILEDRAIRAEFGIKDQIVVLVTSRDKAGIFNPSSIQLIRELTAELAALPGVNLSDVMSLATEPSFRLRPGTATRQKLLDLPFGSREELEQLRDDLRRIELYTGTLLSLDGTSAAILIGAPEGDDRTKLYRAIVKLVAAKHQETGAIQVTGAPVAESLLGIHILEDLGAPQAMLGVSTRSHLERANWKFPASFYEFRRTLAQHIGLLPIGIILMMFTFFLRFRRVLTMLLPVPEVVATLFFVFGLMGWLGVPVYLTIAVMPVLLTAMCVTDEIHVFSRYFALRRENPDVNHVETVRATMGEMIRPITNTTLTTAIGFVSFAFSPLPPVRAFGVFTCAGVLFSLLFSLTAVPAMLTMIPPSLLVCQRQSRTGRRVNVSTWRFGRGAVAVVRHRIWVVLLLVVVIALTSPGLKRLLVQDSWIDGFDPESEFHRATTNVNNHFYGMHTLLLLLDAPEIITGHLPAAAVTHETVQLPDALVKSSAFMIGNTIALRAGDSGQKQINGSSIVWRPFIDVAVRRGQGFLGRTRGEPPPTNFWEQISKAGEVEFEMPVPSHLRSETLQTVAELGAFVRKQQAFAVGGVLSPYDYVATTRFMAQPDNRWPRSIPEVSGEIRRLWDYYAHARGSSRLQQAVSTNYQRSLTTVFMKEANFVDTAKLMSDIRAYEREHLTPKGIKLGFAGDVAVSQSLIKGIVTTQVQSLIWSLGGIYVVTAMLGRSLRYGIICVLPSGLAVLVNFALMGWFGIPLGVATSMFAGMTLGIGVDFAIHLLEGFNSARVAGASTSEAINRAMTLTGPAVLLNTLAISLGFGVLMLSQVPANFYLGLLVVMGFVNCLIFSLLLLPLLLHRCR